MESTNFMNSKNFTEIFNKTDFDYYYKITKNTTPEQIKALLHKPKLTLEDFCNMISAAALEFLEPLAQKAHQITLNRFGRTIQLYAPLYVSNECLNDCLYCGFAKRYKFPRITLTLDEIKAEAEYLHKQKFGHILLVSGEARYCVPVSYFEEIAHLLSPLFPSLCIEIYPLEEEEYIRLVSAGISCLTVYQETYNPTLYSKYHSKGKKKDFYYRLETPDRACRAGMRQLSIGALLGLDDWHKESIVLALHSEYLIHKYWKTKVSASLPRLHNVPDDFDIPHSINDKELVQLLIALRIFLPDLGINLSTRENATFRNHLIPLGVTQMSAGSKTEPGGYSNPDKAGKQFELEDTRTPEEVANYILQAGYEPVWKDWDETFNSG